MNLYSRVGAAGHSFDHLKSSKEVGHTVHATLGSCDGLVKPDPSTPLGFACCCVWFPSPTVALDLLKDLHIAPHLTLCLPHFNLSEYQHHKPAMISEITPGFMG